jgi:demethylmenaquinone methyltransferase / 2-methoxy-6-polyprenyl-1,4-benzoquinol methylase
MSEEIRKMFGSIAGKYDLMNDLLSFGIHKLWRKKLVKIASLIGNERILDCATGTGDLATGFYKKLKNGTVTGLDFAPEMIEIAKQKAAGGANKIDFLVGDATNISFPDSTFDISTIAFGIRNIPDTEKCLSEMARVLKPGGKVMILEFGKPYFPFSLIYKIYAVVFMPLIGKFIAGSSESYKYLQTTSLAYPCRNDFIEIMRKTDKFKKLSFLSLSFGIAYLYIGEK